MDIRASQTTQTDTAKWTWSCSGSRLGIHFDRVSLKVLKIDIEKLNSNYPLTESVRQDLELGCFDESKPNVSPRSSWRPKQSPKCEKY